VVGRGFRITRGGGARGNLATDNGRGRVEIVLSDVEGVKCDVTPQANFSWKITFDTLYTKGFSIRIRSRTLSISSECNVIG